MIKELRAQPNFKWLREQNNQNCCLRWENYSLPTWNTWSHLWQLTLHGLKYIPFNLSFPKITFINPQIYAYPLIIPINKQSVPYLKTPGHWLYIAILWHLKLVLQPQQKVLEVLALQHKYERERSIARERETVRFLSERKRREKKERELWVDLHGLRWPARHLCNNSRRHVLDEPAYKEYIGR